MRKRRQRKTGELGRTDPDVAQLEAADHWLPLGRGPEALVAAPTLVQNEPTDTANRQKWGNAAKKGAMRPFCCVKKNTEHET